MFIPLTAEISVAPQITAADCALAAAGGFTTIVNNRPDGEAPGQPSAAEIGAAAAAAGLRYVHLPVDHSGISLPQVTAMAAAIAASPGPVLAFCRSGTRSTHLWALARASQGADPAAIIAAAATGGYDIEPLMPMLQQLGPGA